MTRAYSYVKKEGDTPSLYVNGEKLCGMAYMTYYTENNRYADFAKAGYRLFSLPVMFGDQTINSITQFPPFQKGIFASDEPDYSVFDGNIRDILEACPNAYIFPRVNVSLSRAWEDAHPDELNDFGSTTFPDIKRASFSSDLWCDEVKRLLSIFVAHIENSDYRDSIVGYQIAGGLTEEWMTFDLRGSRGKRSLEKFGAYAEKNGIAKSEENYSAFLSDTVALRICELAEHVKTLTDNRLAVGAFYGYTFELSSRGSGHNSLRILLDSPYVDFLCSPVSYSTAREAGVDHPYMLPVSSLSLAGKLYFSENDTRTHLTMPSCDLEAYNRPIWYGPDKETTVDILKMHFARALINGHALWWFDMWGGWFADNDYMELFETMKKISENSSADINHKAQTAVFVDERSIFTVKDEEIYRKVVSATRPALGSCGAPFDLYLASDYESVIGDYKALICLEPAETELTKALCRAANEMNKPLLKITEENSDLSSGDIRDFLHSSGVNVYSERDNVVYANNSYVFIHISTQGEQRITVPNGEELREIFGKSIDSNGFAAEKGKSFLFEIKGNIK